MPWLYAYAAALAKLIAKPSVKGVAVPGMPANSPGMGKMDGNLVTVDFLASNFLRINRSKRDEPHEAAWPAPVVRPLGFLYFRRSA